MAKNKLELTWIGKENRPRLEPRILLEVPENSYHAPHRVTENDHFDNRLIFGDNLLALKALEQEFAGKIKCIYIDPPYNTGSAFEHYDDGVEHSLWLTLLRDRLELLHSLLRDDGFLFVQIDNNEMCYLKVMLDEVFGRNNFINDIIWKRRGGSANPSNRLNNVTDYILWYSKSQTYSIKPLYSIDDDNTQKYIAERFTLIDENGRKYRKSPIQSPHLRANLVYEYKGYQPPVKGWSISKEVMEQWDKEGKLDFPKVKTQYINRKMYLDEYPGQPVSNLWSDIPVINPMSKERLDFDGQKPEKLIQRILLLTTDPGDWVLDSFAGTGTTSVVAHKMGRKWITIELGEHCHTYLRPRITRVIDGTDDSGISSDIGWKGGGGFRYYKLAPSLLKQDEFGNWIINDKFNAAMLAEAMCKLEGFVYAPSDEYYWQHGRSTESDFVYVTTQTLTREQLQKLSDEVGDSRSLLVCCGAFRIRNVEDFPNLTLKKIPRAVMDKCEWGKDDYSLEIQSLPVAKKDESSGFIASVFGDGEGGETKVLPQPKMNIRKKRKQLLNQPTLFDGID